ncbi:MAG TPA: ATP-binding protein [Candidatus Binataceae bacterium]|nr:ATP-binding protein [Candidatus Binataceae bacterium]
MKLPSLRTRIRNGTLLMLAIAVGLGAFAVDSVHKLGGAIRETLHRNYISIEAAGHMHEAIYQAQIAAARSGTDPVLQQQREAFEHWISIELGDITEAGESDLARSIASTGKGIFDQLAQGQTPKPEDFIVLHGLLDRLIAMNQAAMFRADSRASKMSDQLAYELSAGLFLLLLFGIVLSWTQAGIIAKPLTELTDHLRGFSLHGPSSRLGDQPLLELQAVADEFNRMAERLEQFDRLNVDRLLYEKGKTEAIIESLEDGIVLIDTGGVVTHINEISAIILGIERGDALGSAFDDLSSSSPHYLRVRDALRRVAIQPFGTQRVEVDLHVRGRAHSYVLKPTPLRQSEGQSFGTLLILQDITYLRDQDRARTNLVATLSHELKTPLTSLGLSIELMLRRNDLDATTRELAVSVQEDAARMRRLATNLLDLARGNGPAITVQFVPTDLGQLLQTVIHGFDAQAAQKGIRLHTNETPPSLEIISDPLKISWVISNLIANALRYTPSGGEITATLEPTEYGARITVVDTGPGIAPELQAHLFERYAQADVNGAERGSAGLGLAIAKEIVDAHGGRIFVTSEPGHGAVFTVELMRSPREAADVADSDRR